MSALDKKNYLAKLKRQLVAAWVANETEKVWPLLTDQELADMVNLIEGAKDRLHKEKKNAKNN